MLHIACLKEYPGFQTSDSGPQVCRLSEQEQLIQEVDREKRLAVATFEVASRCLGQPDVGEKGRVTQSSRFGLSCTEHVQHGLRVGRADSLGEEKPKCDRLSANVGGDWNVGGRFQRAP